MFFDLLSSYRFRRNVSAGLHCHGKIVTSMFLDVAATSSSVDFASFAFSRFFRTRHLEKLYVCKMTISLSSVHVYSLISSIGLTYFHRIKGGQFTTVTYSSVLSNTNK